MKDRISNQDYNNIVVALLVIFPVVINSVKIIGNLILLILVFMGIYILFKEKKSPFKVTELKLLSWLTFGYFVVMLLSIVQNEGFFNELYHLGRKAHFALAPFIALAIYRVKLPLNKLLLSIKIGLIIIGIIVAYQDLSGSTRPSGMYNQNIFGDLVLVMVFFSIVNFVNEEKFSKLITIISLSLGVYAIILSGNRGTLLVMPVLSAVYLYIFFKRELTLDFKKKIIVTIILSAIIASLYSYHSVQGRIMGAYDSLINWSENGHIHSSTGLRLEMWSKSTDAVKESPWFGHGYRNANAIVSNYVDKEAKEAVFNFTHLHNEYLTNLVSAGVIGLIALLAMLFVPLVIFIRGFENNSASLYSVMGILLCISYAGIGLTHIAFGEEHMNAFFIFFLAILLPKVIQERNYSH